MGRGSGLRILVLVGISAAIIVTTPDARAAADIDVPCGDVAALRAAIVTANTDAEPLNTIRLAAGCMYSITEPYAEGSKDGLPPITHNVEIRGYGATLRREPGPDPLANQFRMLHVAAGRLDLDDIAIENGRINANNFAVGGGGLLNEATVNINGATFTGNFIQSGEGGAIDNQGFLSANNVTFENNAAGGGFGQLHIGGAISNSSGASAELRWNNFVLNRAAVGGAIYNVGDLVILESAFDNNLGNRADAAISNGSGGTASIESSYFGLNEAWDGGAIGNGVGASLDIVNTTFRANQAVLRAFSGPTFRDGGAIHNAGNFTGSQLTFSANRAADGAAIFNDDETGSTTLENSIVNGTDPDCGGAIADGGSNLVWPADASCPVSFEVGDPKLATAAPNGAAQAFNLSHRLGAGSMAIDLVPSGDCGSNHDQRGISRPQGTNCDSGAYENQAPGVPGAPVLAAGSNPSNSGEFELDWDTVLDLDVGDAVTYGLFRRDADDADFTLVAATTASQYTFTSGSPESEGTFEYVVEASDGNSSTRSPASAPIVVDKTAPEAPSMLADRAPDYQPDGDRGWYRDDVTVTISADDPVLGDGSPGSGVASVTPSQTIDTSGVHLITATASDYAGNVSPTSSLTVQVDSDDPLVGFTSCPGEVVLRSQATAEWGASDAHSGLVGSPTGSLFLDTSILGEGSVTAAVEDNVGHTTTATCNYRVTYDFQGFFASIKDFPALNDVGGVGRVITLTFSLGGDQGTDIFAESYPLSAPIVCGSATEATEGVLAITSRQGLTVASSGQHRYSYPWKTMPEWKGTCRQFVMKLRDGTFHRANFSFR